MGGIAIDWNRLDEAAKKPLLPTILCRVVWHHADREITIDLIDDAARLLGDEVSLREYKELG